MIQQGTGHMFDLTAPRKETKNDMQPESQAPKCQKRHSAPDRNFQFPTSRHARGPQEPVPPHPGLHEVFGLPGRAEEGAWDVGVGGGTRAADLGTADLRQFEGPGREAVQRSDWT